MKTKNRITKIYKKKSFPLSSKAKMSLSYPMGLQEAAKPTPYAEKTNHLPLVISMRMINTEDMGILSFF